MSIAQVDSKHRVALDRHVRQVSGIEKGEKLTAIPFQKGVILVASEARKFAESLTGFKFIEAEHEASHHLFRQMKKRARP